MVENARAKLKRKRCDWILANDVSPGTGTFGGDSNTIHLVEAAGVEDWPVMTKREVAARLADRIAGSLARLAAALGGPGRAAVDMNVAAARLFEDAGRPEFAVGILAAHP